LKNKIFTTNIKYVKQLENKYFSNFSLKFGIRVLVVANKEKIDLVEKER
jgi:hypothetical protein